MPDRLIPWVVRRTAPRHATIGIMLATVLLVLVVVLVIGGLVFGVVSLLSGDDPGLVPAEPDGRARPLPNDRSLREEDLKAVRFDVALRGYRMAQVDRMLRRTAYDLGYKDEMIAVLEAEVAALREGRLEDADLLRKARESSASPPPANPPATTPAVTEIGVTVEDAAAPAVDGPETDRPETDHPETDHPETDGPEETDGTDGAATEGEPDPPREGSLRRREPADAVAGTDGTAAVDLADRPTHA